MEQLHLEWAVSQLTMPLPNQPKIPNVHKITLWYILTYIVLLYTLYDLTPFCAFRFPKEPLQPLLLLQMSLQVQLDFAVATWILPQIRKEVLAFAVSIVSIGRGRDVKNDFPRTLISREIEAVWRIVVRTSLGFKRDQSSSSDTPHIFIQPFQVEFIRLLLEFISMTTKNVLQLQVQPQLVKLIHFPEVSLALH